MTVHTVSPKGDVPALSLSRDPVLLIGVPWTSNQGAREGLPYTSVVYLPEGFDR